MAKSFNFYACGPTTYADSHLGHARAYVVIDCMRRALCYLGHNVQFAMNITDIDDKIIAKGGPSEWKTVAQHYEQSFWRDMDSLNVLRPDILLRASECLPDIIDFIQGIMQNKFAYQVNGSVYFDMRAYTEAGLARSPFTPTILPEESRGEILNQYAREKRGSYDFALWKAVKPGEPFFPSPWGPGRPGWHIECSAMNRKAFGDEQNVHLHAGGIDLAFPHHSNEILQGIAFYNGRNPFKQFIHVGHLHCGGCKMSKSEPPNTFASIRSVLARMKEKGVSADVVRVAMLRGKPWNRPMEFQESMFEQASASLRTIDSFLARHIFEEVEGFVFESSTRIKDLLVDYKFKFHQLLREAVTWSKENKRDKVPFVLAALNVLGIPQPLPVTNPHALKLIRFRKQARMALYADTLPQCSILDAPTDAPFATKCFRTWYKYLDHVRDVKLKNMGITVEDERNNGNGGDFICWTRI